MERPIRIIYNGDSYECYSDKILFYENNRDGIPCELDPAKVPQAVVKEYHRQIQKLKKKK